MTSNICLRGLKTLVVIAICIALMGCGGGGPRLPDTPNTLRDGSGPEMYAKLPPENRNPEMQVLYITDRLKTGENNGWPYYGYDRSPSVAYGSATVGFKPMPTWDEL